MTVHTHSIEKTARADTEKLPDINGNKIAYAGGVECAYSVMERRNDEPTITAGASVTVGGRTGVCENATAKLLPQYKLDGSVVWETNHVLAVDGDTI